MPPCVPARSIRLGLLALGLGLLACAAEPPSLPPVDALEDAGAAAPLDAGVAGDATVEDSGTTPPADAGLPAVDAGLPAPDSGAGAPDAGTMLADSGAPPPVDAGTPSPDAGATSPDAGAPPTDSGVPVDPGPAVLNPGWIGGPCTTDADCSFTGGRCLTGASGWSGGTCTQDCTRFCPDQTGPLNSVTFCVDDGDGDSDGACLSRCDQTLSPTGCRQGYVCLPDHRMSERGTVRNVCVPRSGFPGRPTPRFDIGEACVSDGDCERATCLSGLPGGYCSQEACDVVGCPSGSRCFRLGLEDYNVCLKTCGSDAECRSGESYACDTDSTCWYSPPTRPGCDLTGGAARCAHWAPQAQGRDFVVATKASRRMTLCDGAREVQSWCMGLGSSPVLDKEREGDRRTPHGVFYIPRRLPQSQFYKAFLLSYPDSADAQRGLSQGLITRAEHDAIVAAQNARREPPQQTGLGGLIEIHGGGGTSDWTWGCLAIDNAAIDRLWTVLDVGDIIVVEP